MTVPPYVVIVVVVVFGFLTGSTVYFYNQSRTFTQSSHGKNTTAFSGPVIKENSSGQPDPIDTLTKPADPRGRLSYPANVYALQPGETLAVLASKLSISQQLIIDANGIVDPNSVQAGQVLAIPKLNNATDYYRLNFIVSADAASKLNISQRTNFDGNLTDPVKVAKSAALSYFNINNNDGFSLGQEDTSKGTATVIVHKSSYDAVIGLIQPKEIGPKGFWAMVYIEQQQTSTP